MSLHEAAAAIGIKRQYARLHLKRVFAKDRRATQSDGPARADLRAGGG